MEDPLKARLIGAVILVALAVLLVPELLSGRKSAAPGEVVAQGDGRGTRTYTIDLTGATPAQAVPDARPKPEEQAPPAAAVAEPQAVPEPGAGESAALAPAEGRSAQSEAAPPSVAPKPAEATPSPKAAPATAELPPAKASVKGGWSVQVGAFGSAATAGKLVAELKSAGYSAYIAPISKGGKTLHRVRVGPEAVRGDADRLAARLKGRKLPTTVVAND
jgi:DedD protein